MNTITPLTSSTGLGSATSQSSGQPPGQKNFKSGEVFKATVMEATGQDLFSIDIAGTRIAAQTKALLSPGQVLQLQVTTLSPQVELKIVSQTPQQFYGRSLTLVSKNIDLSSLVKILHEAAGSSQASQATVKEIKSNDVVILDIGGKQIDAQSSTPLTPGQNLQVQQAVTSTRMEIAFSGGTLTLTGNDAEIANIGKILQPADPAFSDGINKATVLEAKGNNAGPAFTDSIHKATVLEVKGNNVFTLEIAGKQITAQTQTPLLKGQVLDLQDMHLLPQLKLSISPTADQIPETLLILSDNTAELNELTSLLQPKLPIAFDTLSHTTRTTLEDYSTLQHQALAGKDAGVILKNLVDKMGLTLEPLLAKGDKENAVNTLKSALLETAHVFKDAADISKATHQLLGTLEVYQLAQVHMENAANFIFPLPLPFLEKGYLVVEDYRQQEGKEKGGVSPPMRFSLHLTMQDLGNIRIDFLQYQDGLYIRFNTDSKDKSTFVESFSTDLKAALTDTNLLGLTFSENASDPAAELIKRLLPQGSSILDTTA